MVKEYFYGMRLRGFAPMCQPKEGLIGVVSERSEYMMVRQWLKKYHSVIVYDRELSAKELADYELDYLDTLETVLKDGNL